jgi:hypothetical protein
MRPPWIRPLYLIAAVYDLILGVAFLAAQDRIFAWFEVTPPNHPGYVMFGALCVLIFGVAFLLIARAPERNRDLIALGVLFKLAYAVPVLGYHFTGGIPTMWVPWAYADLVFALLFLVSLRALSR